VAKSGRPGAPHFGSRTASEEIEDYFNSLDK